MGPNQDPDVHGNIIYFFTEILTRTTNPVPDVLNPVVINLLSKDIMELYCSTILKYVCTLFPILCR